MSAWEEIGKIMDATNRLGEGIRRGLTGRGADRAGELRAYEVFCPTYRQAVCLLVGPRKAAANFLQDHDWGERRAREFKKATKGADGVCSQGKSGAIVIWMPSFSRSSSEDVSVLLHETLHACKFRSRRYGDTKIRLTHENICWAEMLVRELLEAVRKEEECHE